MGKQWKQCQTLFWGAPKSLQMVIAGMKLKDAYSLEEKLYFIVTRDMSIEFFDGPPRHKLEGENLLLLWKGRVFDMLQQQFYCFLPL